MERNKEIFRDGFIAGYWLYMESDDPTKTLLPANPFPLRTEERRLWSDAHGRGAALAREHMEAVKCAVSG